MENEIRTENAYTLLDAALDGDQMTDFRHVYLEMHPYDQAMYFMQLGKEKRMQLYTYLSPEEMAEIMENIEREDTEPYFIEMDPHFAAMVLGRMSADDAVDILNELDKDQVVSFLTLMDDQPAEEIKQLLHYEEKTAGSIMTTEFVALFKTQTISEVMKQLKQEAPEAETIYYLYVLDEDKRLVGVTSLRDLIIAEETDIIANVMSENVVSVSVAKDQEDIAQMMRDYDFLALPVVDFQSHLLGIITVDDILDVMEEEASDDYSKFAAVMDTDSRTDNPFSAAKKRLPWLIILLFLGMFTASLIGMFEETISRVALLAAFIPVIAGMAGNTGTQALAVAVRGIATGDYGKEGKIKLLAREAGTGAIIGIVCGIVIFVVVLVWKHNLAFGILIGIAIMMTLFVATISGSIIPILMDKLKIDPAVASGPFITTINDLISVIIYFGLATLFLSMLT
ncbi:Magnesium transporter MgtE [Lentibacillus sp. JNUCC-1]|uniref:magnesium transporter n=1 Tax=Lentibacillus sp. JNUCC-1 TaxID=2654513 RepID=UPI0012E81908|nr:magnesium transporter [Lentibacillus sp. JNUCC-1]MUV36503.1 Magnesium transporter MgtE [Lentibacillus sp. JNUCC-1]